MNTQVLNAKRHGIVQDGRVQGSGCRAHRTLRQAVSCSLFTLLLLAGTARAEAQITGGITNKYRLNGVNYISHTFTNTQAITVSSDVNVTYLSVAGGGGGGSHWWSGPAGAGGAGGFLTGTVTLASSASYTVNVGAGGVGAVITANNQEMAGNQGGDSYVTNITSGGAALMRAYGGGGGSNYGDGGAGGSGGGGGVVGPNPRNPSGYVSGQGSAGGAIKGSGGGASTAGSNGPGSAGGLGRTSTLRNSVAAVTYATGGKSHSDTEGSGADGTSNTGDGGESAYTSTPGRGGNGGSGIVILRYVDAAKVYNPTVVATTNTARWASSLGTFRISRPGGAADPDLGLDWATDFTMSGTATNGTDYTGQPATNNQTIVALSTNVLFPAGQVSVDINLYPLYNLSLQEKQATLTLVGSTAGSSTNATVTFPACPKAGTWAVATLSSGAGYTTNYTLGSAPNTTNYSALVFTNSGTLTVTSGGQIEYLIVGGGGGGGNHGGEGSGGGGGAGGFLTGTVTLASGTYAVPVQVGAGGTGSTSATEGSGTHGDDSSLGATAIRAYGGGQGVNYGSGVDGGSGGGSGVNGSGVGGNGWAGPPTRQGYNGGKGGNGYPASGGSGGGAGGPGGVAGDGGGIGVASSIRNGTADTFAHGGESRTTSGAGSVGSANTGNGGGGGYSANGGNGGSGIVIVRVVVVPPPPKGTVIMMR
ncbi:MAG: glycine-rich domain-containing protein [Kiritimatiellia bacterium]